MEEEKRTNKRECPHQQCYKPLNAEDDAWLQANIDRLPITSDSFVVLNEASRELSCRHKATFESAKLVIGGGKAFWLVPRYQIQ